MTKSSLFALFAVAFLFSHHNALADPNTDDTAQQEEESSGTDGNGSTWWPDVADWIEDLVDPNGEG